MKITVSIFVAMLPALFFGHQAFSRPAGNCATQRACVPNPGEVCLFPDPNCTGFPYRKSAVTISGVLYGSTIPNDTLSSFVLGNQTDLYLCSDGDFGGYCHDFVRDDATGQDDSFNYMASATCDPNLAPCDNWTSSLRVSHLPRECGSPAMGTCAFFVDSSFGGSCVVLPVGEYPNQGWFGLPNDSISSILCGASTSVAVYDQSQYLVSLGTYSYQPNMGYANDRVSSFRVLSP